MEDKNLKGTYNLIADDWHRDHRSDNWWIKGTEKFISFFDKGAVVLDAGCGSGEKSKFLIDHGLRVIGIDFSEKMIEISKSNIPEGKFLVMDMKDIEGLDEELDGVFAQASLLHIPKSEVVEVLRGWSDKLKSRGYLYVAVKEKRVNGPEAEVKEENDYGYPYQRFFSYFTMEELMSYFKDLGFGISWRSANPSGRTVWLQIIGRKK